MTARLLAAALACLSAVVLAVAAPRAENGQKITGVVELFTSQGCNSCPAADAVLGELVQRPDIVVLAYHVDYWDYLGWHDTFASRENTRRQKQYKYALGSRSIYTPQAVLNGRAEMNGGDREPILRALKEMAMAGAAPQISVQAGRRGDSLVIDVAAARTQGAGVEVVSDGAPGHAHLLAVSFGPPTPVTIPEGENKGRTIVYWNPVRRIQPVGVWSGKPAHFEVPWTAAAGEGAAVLLQRVEPGGLPGPILGAAVIRKF
ncbi:MAG TPA: DUF1223 domain-containing protein [Mesorhizobium sp.]|jgi:hypothetical protein|nr:DUF1223 domain-containing protein [Mesorhizobium sp.]